MLAISLRNDALHAVVLPGAGAGLARLDWIGGATPLPVFRPLSLTPGAPRPTPSQLACFPMLPWANRLDPSGFEFEGRRHVPAPNREGEPCPIHGDGWQYPWQIEKQSADALTLTLDRHSGETFSYRARLRYALAGRSLRVILGMTNTGAEIMPFGAGLHPFFPRTEGVRLQASAARMWNCGADKLPLGQVPLPPACDFNEAAPPPAALLDNAFERWDGRATITWPATGLSLAIAADMDRYIAYAPVGKDFFCFEPVDHAINAPNLPGGAAANGMTLLAPGQELRRELRFTVSVMA